MPRLLSILSLRSSRHAGGFEFPFVPRARACRLLSALLGGSLALAGLATALWIAPSRALELGGSTVFVRAPWEVELVSYYTTVGQPLPEYYFTIRLDPEAGASLGRFRFEQVRGVDRQFPFSAQLTRAFLGRPRREGATVPVQASFDQATRTMTVDFPTPVPPGSTVTVVVIPWTNPMQSDTYMFRVETLPAGPDPVASPAGFATLRIYNAMTW